MTTPQHRLIASSNIDAVRHVPLFQGLEASVVEAIASALVPHHAPAGDRLFAEGDPGDAMYFIDSGGVMIHSGEGDERVVLAELGPGQFFGEMALALGTARTASATALRECELLELPGPAFRELANRYPALRSAISRVSEHRSASSQLFANEAFDLLSLADAEDRMSLGKDPANTIVLDFPGVAPFHAEIRRVAGGYRLVHLGAPGGTFRNQQRVVESDLVEGDLVRLGSCRLFLHDGKLKLFQAGRGIRVDVRGLGRQVKGGKHLLRDVDLVFYPGEMVAVVGPSGAGKSTMMKLLLGIDSPTSGEVRYDGINLHQNMDRFRSEIGYVPQADIVHPELSARESLGFSGRLRLPGLSGQEIDRRVDQALSQVHLEKAADTSLRLLSGGQRKRACVAVELMTDPRLVFLDEPTSGLDPSLDEQLMLTFRELADAGRTVVLTTHATRNIAVCDLVVILSGGHVVFAGAPTDALAYFNVSDFADIYPQVEGNAPEPMAARFTHSPDRGAWVTTRMADAADEASTAAAAPVPKGPTRGVVGALRQVGPLIRRDAKVVVRDKVNMGLRLIGPPVLALSLVSTFDRDVFTSGGGGGSHAREAITLLYMASIINLFLSTITSSVAITREGPIYRREQLVNLSPVAYVFSKVAVLSVFAVLQVALILGVLLIGIDFPEPASEVLPRVFLALALTSLAGMGLGLLVSSLSPNADRAVVIAVLVIIPQLIYGGFTVPRTLMSPLSQVISDATVTRWSLELLGNISGIDGMIEDESHVSATPPGADEPFTITVTSPFDDTFDVDAGTRWLILVGFVVLFVGATIAIQKLKPKLGLQQE